MKIKFAMLAALVSTMFLVPGAYAHKEQIVGNYKVEVGWKKEPPIVGKANAIEITVTKASAADKKSSSSHDHMDHGKKDKTKSKDMTPSDKKTTPKKTISQKTSSVVFVASDDTKKNTVKEKTMTNKEHTHKETTKSKQPTKQIGISGLSKTLEVSVTLGGKKTFLKLVEDPKKKGTYYGDYTPESVGFPIVHISGKILDTPIDMDFHPEKVQAAK